jgi:hypothetical protein
MADQPRVLGVNMAERPCEPGSMLLLNDFFEVIEKENGRREEGSAGIPMHWFQRGRGAK